MTSALLIGLLIGMRHALEADHIAAVASLAAGSRRPGESVRLGVVWGLGHGLTLFAVGSAVLVLDGVVPERLALGLEVAVGVMLVVLGADVLRRMVRDRVHFHAHPHAGKVHVHAHSHAGEGDHAASPHDHDHGLTGRALVVGLVHGLAGSAGLVVLVLGALDSVWTGVLYMAAFGLGSVAGMAALSLAMAVPLRFGARRLSWAYNGLMASVGLLTIGLGAAVLYQTGMISGL